MNRNRSLPEFHQLSSEPNVISSRERNQASLISVRKSRKQIEQDAQSLANRIALLQKEEGKIWKNLEMAKSRAKELYMLKKRDAQKSRERIIRYHEQNPTTQNLPTTNSVIIRKQREANIQQVKEAIQKQKHREMIIIKKQSELCKVKKQDIEDRIHQENRTKMLHIKKDELISNMKKKAFFEEKLQRVKYLQQKKIEEEEEFKIAKELEILNLEKVEMDLVQRIQQTKVLQQQVYKSLESMLSRPLGPDPETEIQLDKFQFVRDPQETGTMSARIQSLNGSGLGGTYDQENIAKMQLQEERSAKGIRRQSLRG